MKKTFVISFLSAIIATAMPTPAIAQNYVVDNLFGDSVRVEKIIYNDDKTAEWPGETAFYLQPGDTVTVTRILAGNSYPAITVKGKSGEFTIGRQNLKYCDNNPDGAVDQWADEDWNKNTGLKNWFATFTPYAIIAILFIIAALFSWFGFKNNYIRELALIVVPCLLLVASLLEICAYWLMGNSTFWWCDQERYGFWGSLFRVIPFILFVAFQLYSIKPYMRLLTNNEENELSVKPMLLSFGLSVPIAFGVALLCNAVFGLRSQWLGVVTLITFFVSLGTGLFISTKKNLRELGKTAGTLFTLFGMVWAVGAIIAIVGLIIVVFKLIFQILIIAAGCYLMAKNGVSLPTPTLGTPDKMYIDKSGNTHATMALREESNQRIAQKRQENKSH